MDRGASQPRAAAACCPLYPPRPRSMRAPRAGPLQVPRVSRAVPQDLAGALFDNFVPPRVPVPRSPPSVPY